MIELITIICTRLTDDGGGHQDPRAATTNSNANRKTSASRALSTATWNSIAKTAVTKSDAVSFLLLACSYPLGSSITLIRLREWPAKPTILIPPPPMININIGTTIVINCTAVGVPTPEVVWRLNWGHVPSKCTMTSESGYGVLTCKDAQIIDQGAYSCEAINAKVFSQVQLSRLQTLGFLDFSFKTKTKTKHKNE